MYLLICPNCGKEVIDNENVICPDCGKPLVQTEVDHSSTSLQMQPKQPDLVFGAAILTLISATFVASVGYLGLYQYASLIDYFGSTMLPSDLEGFLIFGVVCLVVSVVAMASGMFMLKRNNFKFSILGLVALIISVFVTYIFTPSYSYSFDVKAILLFSEVTVFIFSIISGLFISSSNTEFN